MTDLPTSWNLLPLAAVAEVRLGRQRSPKNHSGTQMRPYLRAANVDWNGLKLDDVKEMNFTDAEMEIYRLEPGDIVLGEASGSASEVGKPGLWSGEIRDCAFQNTLLRVRSHGPEPRYLLHWFRHLAAAGAFAAQSRGVGIHHIGRAKLAAWPVPIPPIDEQRRIVDILEDHLSRIDAADATVRSSVKQLAGLRRSALNAITERYATDHVALSDLVAGIEAGKSFGSAARTSTDDEWGILKVSAMTWGEFRPAENKVVMDPSKVDPRYQVHAGDLLVSRANTSDYVGASVLVRTEPSRLLLSDKSLRVIPIGGVEAEFVWRALSAPRARQQISDRASGNQDSMRNISQAALLAVEVPRLVRHDQEAVIAEANELDQSSVRLRSALASAIERSAALRRALLATAFSGRLTGASSDAEVIEEMAGV